jgi:hypothetical protein
MAAQKRYSSLNHPTAIAPEPKKRHQKQDGSGRQQEKIQKRNDRHSNLISKYYAASLEVQCLEGKMEKDETHGMGRKGMKAHGAGNGWPRKGTARRGKAFASDDERFFGCVRSDTTHFL